MAELQDQQARNRIERDALDCNMVVLAGAGAGKTHALVERMVNYARLVSPQIDRVAAITFTRKAAGEMRGRFLLRLQERLAEARARKPSACSRPSIGSTSALSARSTPSAASCCANAPSKRASVPILRSWTSAKRRG